VESALVALGQTPELAAAAAPYAQIMAAGLPFALGFYVMRNFATALGRPNAPLAVMLCAVPLNVVLDYGLIFGELGLPELGLYGAAIATSALNAFAFIAMLAIATFSRDFKPYRIWRRFHRADWARLAEIFRLGSSIGLTMVFEVALFAGSTLVIGHFGVAAVAAHNIAMNIPSITFMVPLGIAMAATVRVGYAVGARDRVGVRRAGLSALVIGSAFMLVCSVILAGLPRQIVGLYLDLADPANDAAVAHAVSFLYAVAAFQVLDGIQVIAAFALRGLKDVRAPMILAGISYWVIGFPLMLFLAFGLGWNGIGVWIALAGSLVAAAALLSARFLYMSARR
jgi:MATE family multidrug resistance protein